LLLFYYYIFIIYFKVQRYNFILIWEKKEFFSSPDVGFRPKE